jgi:hypothetical protein
VNQALGQQLAADPPKRGRGDVLDRADDTPVMIAAIRRHLLDRKAECRLAISEGPGIGLAAKIDGPPWPITVVESGWSNLGFHRTPEIPRADGR